MFWAAYLLCVPRAGTLHVNISATGNLHGQQQTHTCHFPFVHASDELSTQLSMNLGPFKNRPGQLSPIQATNGPRDPNFTPFMVGVHLIFYDSMKMYTYLTYPKANINNHQSPCATSRAAHCYIHTYIHEYVYVQKTENSAPRLAEISIDSRYTS